VWLGTAPKASQVSGEFLHANRLAPCERTLLPANDARLGEIRLDLWLKEAQARGSHRVAEGSGA
jgi:hypothetical protein